VCERRRVDQLVLRIADLIADGLRTPAFRIEPDRLQHGLHETQRLICVVNAERAVPAKAIRVPPEKTRADRVEGADPHAGGLGIEEPGDPLSHLSGSFVRESDSEHPIGRHAVMMNQVAHARREDAGLS